VIVGKRADGAGDRGIVISTKGEARTEKSGDGRHMLATRGEIPPLRPAFGSPSVGMTFAGIDPPNLPTNENQLEIP